MNYFNKMKYVISILCIMSIQVTAKELKKPQTPSQLHEIFHEYFLEKNIEGLLSLFDEEAIFIIDKEGRKARGKAEIKKNLMPYLESGSTISTISKSIHINGDIALIRSEWEIDSSQSGVALEVMQYKNGGWVYIIDNPNGF